MSLINELKRRNVFRVGIAYVIVAWLILQVVDVVLNNIEAPGWVFQATLLLLGVGFAVVLIFSWVFELTPEGIKRESDIDRTTSIAPQTGKKLDRLITSVLVLAVAYFLVDKFVLSAGREAAAVEAALQQAQQQNEAAEETPPAVINDKSIAVLPFVNMSDDAGNEYFSDGISEEILNALARVQELKVAGRTSSFAFKGQNQDLRVIGEALGVQHILEGSVRKAGDRVRITAQLVKVEDGFHLWSDTYDRQLNDVFAIQDEIANAILGELKTALLDEMPAIASTRADTEAYDLYLLAKQRIYERTKLQLESAVELLDRAIAIDPDYAPAWAQRGIAALLLSDTSYGDVPQDVAQAEGKRFLDHALELDENLAEAWAGLGLYYNGPPLLANKGIEVLEKARAINPSLVNAGNWLVLAYWGVNRVSDAMALLDEITTRDPLYKPAFGNRIFLLTQTGRIEEARAYIDHIERFIPDEAQILQTRAWVDFEEGKAADALKRMQAALERQPTDRVFRVGVNQGHLKTHQYEKVLDDHWSDAIVDALVALDRREEAGIIAQRRADEGRVGALFWYLNVTGQHTRLVRYFNEHWDSLEAFQQTVPPGLLGWTEMADLAYAYAQVGNRERFVEAMNRLDEANQSSYSQGVRSRRLWSLMASHAALRDEQARALDYLGKAVDSGMMVTARITDTYPWYTDMEGLPEYEAIQARMVDNINEQRALLGLGPI